MTDNSHKGVMVCVTGQRSCERLIMHGAERSKPGEDGEHLPIHVVHCAQTGHNFMNTPYEADAIEYLFTCAQVVGAELSILRADDVVDALVDYAVSNNVGVIVMGASPDTSSYRADISEKETESENTRKRHMGNIAMRLQRRLPDVEFDVIG